MKIYLIPAVIMGMAVAGSCKKDQIDPSVMKTNPNPVRKVQFELYTDQNFAGNKGAIQFRVEMKKADDIIFDSAMATIKIEDIPNFDHRIMIEKLVPGNDTATLAVGFRYTIENVGISWYFEEFEANDTFKLVRYSFR